MNDMKKLSDYPVLMKSTDAKDVLNCSSRMVSKMCSDGTLKATKVGTDWRINRDALFEYAGLSGEMVMCDEA